MTEIEIVRSLLLRIGRGVSATSSLAKAILEWAQPRAEWLGITMVEADKPLEWDAVLASAGLAAPCDQPMPHVLQLADALADLLVLEPFDRRLLRLLIACNRLPRLGPLVRIAARHGHDLPQLLGEMAGAPPEDAERAVRCSSILQLGVVGFAANRDGDAWIDVRWTLEKLLDRAAAGAAEMIDTLVGASQPAVLDLEDFSHVGDAGFLVRLLRGTLEKKAIGINILIHGPPGTGKTEFARTLAAAAGTTLRGVGEADTDGDEPQRWERVAALHLAQRLLGGAGGSILLFDEMEDVTADARPSTGDWMTGRAGSKVFVNRMLETNPVPVIWTTNAIGNIDPAILRRMSFVLKLDMPPRSAALRMLDRIARDEAVEPCEGITKLLDAAPETATVLRVAARAGSLAGEPDGGVQSATSLIRALRGGEMPLDQSELVDLDMFETDHAIAPMLAGMQACEAADATLLLTGPPGTGKTAFAHHLARALDRPLIVKRASDLLSKWVGGTEAQIADAFAQARRQGGVLLFDEVDSLLFDRADAKTSWEVSQVNELLTWLDRHPLPVVAATNHAGRLDPATLRRFVFKIALRPLRPERAARAFESFFGISAPAVLGEIGNLTPGDFAVVARQLRFMPTRDAAELVDRLRIECAAKRESGGRIGF